MTAKSLSYDEEVYTSAAELLDRSSANLGVVAKTRNFPRDVETELAWQRAYTILPNIPIEDVPRHPPRFVLGPCGTRKERFSVSRIVFAGADHTGRTTPLAHHTVFRRDDMKEAGVAPWAVATAVKSTFRGQWLGEPQWIDPPPSVAPAASPTDVRPRPLETWRSLLPPDRFQAVLASMADALVRFPADARPVVVCVPLERACDVLDLMVGLFILLPETIQYEILSASHVVETSDCRREAALLFTYPETPFLLQCRQRQDAGKPLLFDLTRPDSLPTAPEGDYAAVLCQRWRDAEPSPPLSATRAWDKLAISGGDTALFRKVLELGCDLPRARSPDALDSLAGRLTDLSQSQDLSEATSAYLAKQAGQMLDAARKWPSPDCWLGLARIRRDNRWPDEVRESAFEGLCSHAEEALPHFIDVRRADSPQEAEINSVLRKILASRPDLVTKALNRAIESHAAAATDADVARHLIDASRPSFDTALDWADRLLAAPETIRTDLLAGACRRLRGKMDSTREIERLCRHKTGHTETDARFRRDVCVPVLRDVLNSQKTPEAWRMVADRLFQTAAGLGTAAAEVRCLAKKYPGHVTAELAPQWLRHHAVAETPQQQELEDVFRDLGLLPSVEVQTPVDLPHIQQGPRRMLPRRRGHSSPGPVRIPICLAIGLVVLWVLQRLGLSLARTVAMVPVIGRVADVFAESARVLPWWCGAIAPAAIGVCLLVEVYIRSFWSNCGDRLWIVRLYRWTATVLLSGLLILTLALIGVSMTAGGAGTRKDRSLKESSKAKSSATKRSKKTTPAKQERSSGKRDAGHATKSGKKGNGQ